MASTAFLAGERLKAGSIWFHLLVARLARLIAWGDRLSYVILNRSTLNPTKGARRNVPFRKKG